MIFLELLHIPTLTVILAGLFALMTGIMLAARRMNPDVRGVHFWCASYALQAIGALSLTQLPFVSPGLSIVLNNFCFQLGALLLLQGIRSHLGRLTLPATLIAALIALYMALINFFTFVYDSYPVRAAAFSTFYTLSYMAIAMTLWRQKRSRERNQQQKDLPARHFLRVVCLLTGGFHLIRVALMLAAPNTAGFISPHADASWILMSSIFGCVLTGLGLVLLINEHLADKLKSLSRIDPLTECFNRRAFMDIFEQYLTRGFQSENNQGLCLLMLDLDHFKKINDTYGHSGGDAVLRDFANCARSVLRPQDSLCRWGGEEFAVAIPDISPSAAQNLARRLNQAVREREVDNGMDVIRYRVSIGLTHTHHPRPSQLLIEEADEALYSAKTRGRDQVCVA